MPIHDAELGDGDRVLVVGHGGWIESVIAGLLDPELAPALGGSFWHLDAMCLGIDATSSVLLEAVDGYPR